jgi:hypothetical protein
MRITKSLAAGVAALPSLALGGKALRSPGRPARCFGLVAIVLGLLFPGRATAQVGTWTNIIQPAPNPVGLMLLLPDGTVMAQQSGTTANWYKLTPDSQGSYVNGSWTSIHPMTYSRQYYSSAVLRDGRVFVAGGEYPILPAINGSTAEIYDPRNDSWAAIALPPGLICTNCNNSPGFADAGCVLRPDGTVLISPVEPATSGGTVIFNPVSNSLSQGPTLAYGFDTDEQSWVKLPDDSILTFNSAFQSQRYIPSLTNWIPDRPLPAQPYNSVSEIGPGLLLANGKAIFFGGTGTNLLYTPSGNTNWGTWTLATNLPSPFCGWDNPAAMMVNGKVLCLFGCGQVPDGIFEYDPAADTFTPAGNWDNSGIAHYMLALPDGNILMTDGSLTTVHIYIPYGMPLPAGKPAISGITPNVAGVSYHLTGTGLNGISQGAAFGDDAQMDSNYPLVRMTNSVTGNVYFARTYNWSSTGVMTGNAVVSTEFEVPDNVPAGTYSLVVVANGNPSDPVSFTYTGHAWVDFTYTFIVQDGYYQFPFGTLVQATNAVSSGGAIEIKGPSIDATGGPASSSAAITINKPMTVIAVGGPATIGQ